MAMALGKIARLVTGQVWRLTGVVLAVVAVLAGLFLFIDNQHDVGVGQFNVSDALVLALLLLPGQLVVFMPIAALLGALLGLGQLGRESAFIIARSVGFSPWRLAQAAGLAGVVLASVSLLAGELVNPALTRFADQWRAEAKGESVSQLQGATVWVRDGARFLRFARPAQADQPGGVQLFEFATVDAERQELTTLASAQSGSVNEAGLWQLNQVDALALDGTHVTRTQLAQYQVQGTAYRGVLTLAAVDPDGLPLWDIWRQIKFLTQNGQTARALQMSLHNRLAHALATIVLTMLAVVFVLGVQRSGQGVRLAQGVAIGLVYLLLTRTIESGGTVYQWSPLVVAWLPLLLLSCVTVVALWRAR